MERSIDIILDDLKNSIVGTLNNSGLPLSIIAMALNEINTGIQLQSKNALEVSKQNYYNAMQQEKSVEGEVAETVEKEVK